MDSNDDDRSPQVLALTTSLLVLATIAVILHMIARNGSRTGLWLDDLFILLAWVSSMRITGGYLALVPRQ